MRLTLSSASCSGVCCCEARIVRGDGTRDSLTPIQHIGNINTFNRSPLISMAAGLLADQPGLVHEATDFKAANHGALLAHHSHNAAATGRTAALDEQLMYSTAQCHTLGVNAFASLQIRVVARAWHIEHGTQNRNRFSATDLIDYFVRSIPSDMSSAVAFFKMLFSRSRRSTRAANS